MAKMYINGELVDAQGGKTMDVRNPSNGEVVGSIPRGSSSDVDAAIDAAAKAFPAWAAMPPTKRAQLMHAAAEKMKAAVPEIAKLLTLEQGKPLAHAVLEASRVQMQQPIDAVMGDDVVPMRAVGVGAQHQRRCRVQAVEPVEDVALQREVARPRVEEFRQHGVAAVGVAQLAEQPRRVDAPRADARRLDRRRDAFMRDRLLQQRRDAVEHHRIVVVDDDAAEVEDERGLRHSIRSQPCIPSLSCGRNRAL